jgi:hypothetical protein
MQDLGKIARPSHALMVLEDCFEAVIVGMADIDADFCQDIDRVACLLRQLRRKAVGKELERERQCERHAARKAAGLFPWDRLTTPIPSEPETYDEEVQNSAATPTSPRQVLLGFSSACLYCRVRAHGYMLPLRACSLRCPCSAGQPRTG